MQMPTIGMIVLYHPGTTEDFAGGHAPVPAIVVATNADTLDLAVIDRAGRVVLRTRPLSAEAWAARGRDRAIGHYAACAVAQPGA